MTTETEKLYPEEALDIARKYRKQGIDHLSAAQRALKDCISQGLIVTILDGMELQLTNALNRED